MTTTHLHAHSRHPAATAVGSTLVVLPLVGGLGAGLMALGGRFGGPDNAFTAVWYVAAAAAPLALVGAAVLVLAHLHDEHLKPLALWAAAAAGGWVFGLGSAQVTGLADGSSTGAWEYALLGIGVGIYLIGLVGLAWTGRRAVR